MKNTILFKILIILIIALHSQVQGDKGSLRVGMELSYPPFESISPEGTPFGVSVDIAHALGKFLKKDVVIQNISFVGLIPSLKDKKIDVIISSMTITDQRKKSIDFSKPYATTGLSLLLNIDSPVMNIKDLNLPERTVVVKSGTSGEVYAAKYLTQATVRVLDKENLCVMEVIQKKADAFIYDQLSVYRNWQLNQGKTKALLQPFQKEYWGIGIRRGDNELLDQVNQFIDAYKKEGGFQELSQKYFPKEKLMFQKLGIPFIF